MCVKNTHCCSELMEKAERSAPATSRWGALVLRWGSKDVPTNTTTAALPELSLSSPPRRPTKKQRGNPTDPGTSESRNTDPPLRNIVKSSSDIHSVKLKTMQHGHGQKLEHSKQSPNATSGSNVSNCTAPSGQLDYPIGTPVQKVC